MSNFFTRNGFYKASKRNGEPIGETPISNYRPTDRLFIHKENVVPIEKDLALEGYQKAKENDGNIDALEIHLSLIKEGNIVEKNSQIKLTDENRKSYKQKIIDCQSEILKNKNEIKDIQDNKIPSAENERVNLKKEIDSIVTDKDPQYLLGKTFNSIKFSITLFFLTALTTYLFLFYVSAIQSAFFRNIELEMKNLNQGTANLGILLNSIFNPNALFDAGNEIYILLLAPFLFFGFGYSTHIIYENSNKYRTFLISLILVITFVSDGLVTYKIDKSVNDFTSLIKLENIHWVWYQSVNFYIVLVMGFIGLLIWSVILHSLLNEVGKKDISKIKNSVIQSKQSKIDALSVKINLYKSDVASKESEINVSNNKIDHYNSIANSNSSIVTIETVLTSIDSFSTGWIKFLSEYRNPETEARTKNCAKLIKEFKDGLKP